MTSWPYFSTQCRKDVDAVLRSGQLTAYRANLSWGSIGPRKDSQAWRLEREIEQKFRVRHAVVVNSGTAALHASLHAVGVRGREVVVSPFSFSATVSSIVQAGGIPRFADIDPHTFCITKETVKPHVTKKTAAILHVNLFGYFPDLSPLLDFGVPLLEDACQSVGASRGGVYSGTFGLAGAYSFNGSKNLPSGEGGCLVTNSDKIAEKAKLLVNHGENFYQERKGEHASSELGSVGYNYRMHELVACIARHGLKELDERNQRRRELCEAATVKLPDFRRKCDSECRKLGKYHGHLACWAGQHSNEVIKGVGYKERYIGSHHVHYVHPMLVYIGRDKFISRCAKRGLTIQESYTTPLHHLKAFRKYATRELPVVEELHRKTLCLVTTLTPEKPLSYARKVAEIIRGALE